METLGMTESLKNMTLNFTFALYRTQFALTSIVDSALDTRCEVHRFINRQALNILKNDYFNEPYTFFKQNIEHLNAGVIWADKHLKNLGHFYNPLKQKGFFKGINALTLAKKYYEKALCNWKGQDIINSVFYLGGAIHLVQDITVPHHANLRLLGKHKQFEIFVRKTYFNNQDFLASTGGFYTINCIEEAINICAQNAINICTKPISGTEDENFYEITRNILPIAQRATAGCLAMFYKDVNKP